MRSSRWFGFAGISRKSQRTKLLSVLCESVVKEHKVRKSTLYISFILLCSAILVFLLIGYPLIGAERYEESLQKKTEIVKSLQLTDLCLFTEARYTRHLSQADLFSAFQDHPMSFEHFPSGSLTLPPIRFTAEDAEVAEKKVK